MQLPGMLPCSAQARAGRLGRAVRAGALAAVWVGASAFADEPVPVEMTAVQIGPNSHCVPCSAGGSAANAGFVVTANSVVVIDALDSPAQANRLLDEVRRITRKPVSHVLVTRFPAEPAPGLPVLKAAGAQIVAHRPGQPAVRADGSDVEPAHPPDGAEAGKPRQADLWLDDSADLLIGGVHIQAQAVTRSQAPEEMAFFMPEEGVLFAGDLVAPGRVPAVGDADSRRWIAALDELLALDVRVLVPGRGAPSSRPAVDLKSTRDYLVFLRESMGEAVRKLEPFDAAYDKVDWGRFADLAMFDAVNRSNASTTYLRMQRESD